MIFAFHFFCSSHVSLAAVFPKSRIFSILGGINIYYICLSYAMWRMAYLLFTGLFSFVLFLICDWIFALNIGWFLVNANILSVFIYTWSWGMIYTKSTCYGNSRKLGYSLWFSIYEEYFIFHLAEYLFYGENITVIERNCYASIYFLIIRLHEQHLKLFNVFWSGTLKTHRPSV